MLLNNIVFFSYIVKFTWTITVIWASHVKVFFYFYFCLFAPEGEKNKLNTNHHIHSYLVSVVIRSRLTFSCEMCFNFGLYINFFLYSTLTKVLDVSIWKSPVAGWGWESIEAKDDWLRWLPVPFGLGFHLTMCVWPLPPLDPWLT